MRQRVQGAARCSTIRAGLQRTFCFCWAAAQNGMMHECSAECSLPLPEAGSCYAHALYLARTLASLPTGRRSLLGSVRQKKSFTLSSLAIRQKIGREGGEEEEGEAEGQRTASRLAVPHHGLFWLVLGTLQRGSRRIPISALLAGNDVGCCGGCAGAGGCVPPPLMLRPLLLRVSLQDSVFPSLSQEHR